jgi:hypothetical protein
MYFPRCVDIAEPPVTQATATRKADLQWASFLFRLMRRRYDSPFLRGQDHGVGAGSRFRPNPRGEPVFQSQSVETRIQEKTISMVDVVAETEEQLINRAIDALSSCHWVVGECAVQWTRRHARGRTDADFGSQVGLSGDQVYQRRRVFERFAGIRDRYPNCKWSHFYAALTWDNAEDCLQWAEETRGTVSEMRAWRRALLGEDLTQSPDDETPPFSFVPSEASWVQSPGEGGERPGVRRGLSAGGDSDDTRQSGFAREVDDESAGYSPYRKGAGSPPPGERVEATSAVPKITPEQALRRMTTTLERCLRVFTPEFVAELSDLPDGVLEKFQKAAAALNSQAQKLG